VQQMKTISWKRSQRFSDTTACVLRKRTVGSVLFIFFIDFYSVELLDGSFWLNDQIIAFYFQYLESHVFKDHLRSLLFIPPAVTQLIKMSPTKDTKSIIDSLDPRSRKKIFFFAVNDNESSQAGGTHWSLLVFSKPESTFFHFDSIANINRSAALKISRLLQIGLNCPTANFQDHDCAQQINSFDCGVHLLANAENIANFFLKNEVVKDVPSVTQQNISNMRSKILRSITEIGGNV
jgi:sentrin-specific protease 8